MHFIICQRRFSNSHFLALEPKSVANTFAHCGFVQDGIVPHCLMNGVNEDSFNELLATMEWLQMAREENIGYVQAEINDEE